jgi:hypothetical protein
VYFLPTDDPWPLAVLNSPAAWWYCWRKAQHGKDGARRLERQVADAVNAAYGLTREEVTLLWQTAPPRMPLGPPV